jgi:hypothetical protein
MFLKHHLGVSKKAFLFNGKASLRFCSNDEHFDVE